MELSVFRWHAAVTANTTTSNDRSKLSDIREIYRPAGARVDEYFNVTHRPLSARLATPAFIDPMQAKLVSKLRGAAIDVHTEC
jgi:hypothetical protein